MKAFTDLFLALDASNKTSSKVAALEDYFRRTPPEDAIWALHFLTGGRVKRAMPTAFLREAAAQQAGIPLWLFEDSYHHVGDLAETISLLLPPPEAPLPLPLHEHVRRYIEPLPRLAPEERVALLRDAWSRLDAPQRLTHHKLIGGGFRAGVGKALVLRAFAQAHGLEPALVADRLAGQWSPTPEFHSRLIGPGTEMEDAARPYPFCLAHPLDTPLEDLGEPSQWQAEWKWDGIRAQILRRASEARIWSRGGEAITDRFPELRDAALALPDGTVLDGEVLAWADDRPLPFSALQTRIGRKRVSARILAECPVRFIAYDLLEHEGQDLRSRPLQVRRTLLESLLAASGGLGALLASPRLSFEAWQDLASARGTSRERGVEGLMLKRKESAYASGRARGDWWKWKVDPFSCDCVLIYAQAGHGRRAGLHTDYTFGVWNGGQLVPVMKAYSGLSDAEIRELDQWVRRNTLEKFGPVRSVPPEQVFELAFEGIAKSSRHKSGLAVRFPRIVRWRRDKPPSQADSLDSLSALLEASTQ